MIRWVLRRAIDKVEWEWNDNASHLYERFDASLRAAWLVSRVTHLLAAVVLIGALGLAAPSAAQVSGQSPVVSVSSVTPERIAATVAAVAGLIGALVGGLALVHSARRIGAGRRGAIVALVLGPIGLVIGGLVVATAEGGVGTGNGLAGGVVAMAVGLIGMTLGGLALARTRRIA